MLNGENVNEKQIKKQENRKNINKADKSDS